MTRAGILTIAGIVPLLVFTTACDDEPLVPAAVERSSCDATRPTGTVITVDLPVPVKIPDLPTWRVSDRLTKDEHVMVAIIDGNYASFTVRVTRPVDLDDMDYSLRFAAGVNDQPRYRNEVRTPITVCGYRGFEVTGTQASSERAQVGRISRRTGRGTEPLIKERTVLREPIGGKPYIIAVRSWINDVVPTFDADLTALFDNMEIPGS